MACRCAMWSDRLRRMAVAVALLLVVGCLPALAERRVALVIGNSAYRAAPALANPRNDAEDIAAVLQRLGFETLTALDADRTAMEKAAEEFAARTETADVALFYYAGHGLQHQGVNFLVPVDASLQSATGLRRMTRLDDILSDVRKARALRIVVLDACRDNPMSAALAAGPAAPGSSATRSIGLAKLQRTLDAPGGPSREAVRTGDIVVYAAEAGRTASDGADRNSPFTAALLRNIETEGQEVVTLMRRVATSVQQETGGEQRPELLLAVPFEFYFKPGAPQAPPTVHQLVPAARPHEAAAIEVQVEAIVAARPAAEREQARREVLVLLSDIAGRSGLKPDQIAAELPRAHARLVQMRGEIAQFRSLAEAEPGVAPFVELAAAAVASGRRPDLAAADQALAEAQARYDESIRTRREALERTRAKRAALTEQRGHIAETERRTKEAASFYLEAAKDTPDDDAEAAGRRFAMAASALLAHGTIFFANDDLREAIRLFEGEALVRLGRANAATDEQRRLLTALSALVLAELADAQTRLGGRTPGYDGAKMMVDARATYGRALRGIDIAAFPALAMDILDRRAQRDIEFGRRITKDRGRGHFAEAVGAMRTILSIQQDKSAYAGEVPRTVNNLANALKELSRRTEGAEGDRLIDEAVALYDWAVGDLERQGDEHRLPVARANLAHALTMRAARREGLAGQPDIDRAKALFAAIGAGLEQARNPRLWAIVKQHEAEMLRLVGERATAPDAKFAALKASFETWQRILPITSRETAPNDWAVLCAEMGHAIVAVLPMLDGANRKRFSDNAVGLFGNARPYFVAGGFGQDLERLDAALAVARQTAAP